MADSPPVPASDKPCYLIGIAYNGLTPPPPESTGAARGLGEGRRRLSLQTTRVLMDKSMAELEGEAYALTDEERALLYHDPAARIPREHALNVDLNDYPVCDNHGRPVGAIIKNWVSDDGQKIRIFAKVWDVETAQKIRTQVYNGLSIGYDASTTMDSGGHRVVTGHTIREVSVCDEPYFPDCTIECRASNRNPTITTTTTTTTRGDPLAVLMARPAIKSNFSGYKESPCNVLVTTTADAAMSESSSAVTPPAPSKKKSLPEGGDTLEEVMRELAQAKEALRTQKKQNDELTEAQRGFMEKEKKRQTEYVASQKSNLSDVMRVFCEHAGFESVDKMPENMRNLLENTFQNEDFADWARALNKVTSVLTTTANEAKEATTRADQLAQARDELDREVQTYKKANRAAPVRDMDDVWAKRTDNDDDGDGNDGADDAPGDPAPSAPKGDQGGRGRKRKHEETVDNDAFAALMDPTRRPSSSSSTISVQASADPRTGAPPGNALFELLRKMPAVHPHEKTLQHLAGRVIGEKRS
jgi:hypothetical protein